MNLVALLRKALPPFATSLARNLVKLTDPYVVGSYSQEGEDMVMHRFLEGRAKGFYVDVGAHHPTLYSNTSFFYVRGWSGINIEPSPMAAELFNRIRRRDINVAKGVGDTTGKLTYYIFDDPALNTFDEVLMRDRETQTSYRVVETKEISVERLETILEHHLPEGQAIDFMSVDVEGFDLRVLRSNDWTRYRPEFVLVEALDFNFENADKHPLHSFMSRVDYKLVAKTRNTLFYHEVK